MYVFTPTPNSRMPQAGLYYPADDGKQWRMAQHTGLIGSPASLAVHPTQSHMVAIGTRNGLFLSQDYRANFQHLAKASQVLAVSFAVDGQSLWFSSFDGKPALTRMQWQTGQSVVVPLPSLEQDTVTYMAQNPLPPREWAIATYKRDVYISSDTGQTWKQIAAQGGTL